MFNTKRKNRHPTHRCRLRKERRMERNEYQKVQDLTTQKERKNALSVKGKKNKLYHRGDSR